MIISVINGISLSLSLSHSLQKTLSFSFSLSVDTTPCDSCKHTGLSNLYWQRLLQALPVPRPRGCLDDEGLYTKVFGIGVVAEGFDVKRHDETEMSTARLDLSNAPTIWESSARGDLSCRHPQAMVLLTRSDGTGLGCVR